MTIGAACFTIMLAAVPKTFDGLWSAATPLERAVVLGEEAMAPCACAKDQAACEANKTKSRSALRKGVTLRLTTKGPQLGPEGSGATGGVKVEFEERMVTSSLCEACVPADCTGEYAQRGLVVDRDGVEFVTDKQPLWTGTVPLGPAKSIDELLHDVAAEIVVDIVDARTVNSTNTEMGPKKAKELKALNDDLARSLPNLHAKDPALRAHAEQAVARGRASIACVERLSVKSTVLTVKVRLKAIRLMSGSTILFSQPPSELPRAAAHGN